MSTGRTITPQAQRTAAFDLCSVIAAICAAWVVSRWWLYPALNIAEGAPYILRPIAGFVIAWWLLYRAGSSWRELGLATPPSWTLAVAGGVALYALNWALSRWLVPVLARVLDAQPQPSFMAYVHGNFPAFLQWIAIAWLVGGVCEELLFRGFLLNRVAALCGGGAGGFAAGIVAQAALFGALHLYAGTFGFVYAAVFAVTAGVFYLLVKRNLWPLIVVHGLWNSLAIWSVYSG